MPGLPGSNSSVMPGEAIRCSASAAAASKAGSANTESGGNTTIRKQVPPGSGSWRRTAGVGSEPSRRSGSPGPVAHSIVVLIPGTCTRS